MLRNRVPALGLAAVLAGGMYWQTRGGQQEPRARDGSTDVSAALQGAAGTGGSSAASTGPRQDPKDTRVASNLSTVPSKKTSENPDHRKQPGLA
jgi:hypothetical protein